MLWFLPLLNFDYCNREERRYGHLSSMQTPSPLSSVKEELTMLTGIICIINDSLINVQQTYTVWTFLRIKGRWKILSQEAPGDRAVEIVTQTMPFRSLAVQGNKGWEGAMEEYGESLERPTHAYRGAKSRQKGLAECRRGKRNTARPWKLEGVEGRIKRWREWFWTEGIPLLLKFRTGMNTHLEVWRSFLYFIYKSNSPNNLRMIELLIFWRKKRYEKNFQ